MTVDHEKELSMLNADHSKEIAEWIQKVKQSESALDNQSNVKI